MRATLDWSHHLLTRRERRAFARLGVFAGGFDLSAAQEVTDVNVDVLGSLVNKSLVARAPNARFFMLDLILQFAREHFDQLPDREDLRRRHAEYYIGLPTRGSPRTKFAFTHLPTTTDMTARELENYRAAAEWARSRNEFELLVAAADAGFQMRVPVAEAASWLDAALPHLAELDAAVGLRALIRYSAICWILDDFARARSLAEEALDGARKIHDEAAEMKSLLVLGDSLCLLGEYDKARRALGQSLALAEQQHDFAAQAQLLRDSGENERRAGRLDRARDFLESALRLTRDDERARPLRPTVLHVLGDAERLGAQYTLAQQHYVAALLESQRIGEDRYAISHLYGLAAVALAVGDPRRAVVLWGGAKAHEEAIGRRLPRYQREEYEGALSPVAADASAAAARSAQTLDFEEVIQYALEGTTPTS
jgi:tetratricopeptide (TPR) repeat protein